MLAGESVKATAYNVSFVKGVGYNDKEFGVPPTSKYNCEHVHMCMAVPTNKVIYSNVISHIHRHARCV